MTGTPASKVASALALDGFRLRVRSGGLSFTGHVDLRGTKVPVRLDYEGTEFSAPATVVIEKPELLGNRVVPHLEEGNSLCAVDPRQYVSDRYLAAEQARGIVVRVAEVLEKGLHASAVDEIAAEFPRHWGGNVLGVEFAPFDGFAAAGSDPQGKLVFRSGGRSRSATAAAVVLKTDVALSFRSDQVRPETLGAAIAWANSWDVSLGPRMRDGLSALSPRNPHVIICAPNGIVAFEVDVASRGSKVVSAVSRPSGWALLLRGAFGQNLPIRRLQGRRVDMEYLLGTNSSSGVAPLAGKRIVLVGCGAIGGYLALALAQLGAGLSGGTLTLIDDDTLSKRNVGRHRLGVDKVGLPKAEACRTEILTCLPGLNVSALVQKVDGHRSRVRLADLVVDATGEQAVGEMLNAWRLEDGNMTLLHVWIAGNGAAVQSYFSSDSEFGCYRCLRPDHLGPERFPVLRPEADRGLVTGCGEAPFSPYGPSAPLSAASLAAHHAADWALGKHRPLLRTTRLSYADTQERKPANPAPSSTCPACARTR